MWRDLCAEINQECEQRTQVPFHLSVRLWIKAYVRLSTSSIKLYQWHACIPVVGEMPLKLSVKIETQRPPLIVSSVLSTFIPFMGLITLCFRSSSTSCPPPWFGARFGNNYWQLQISQLSSPGFSWLGNTYLLECQHHPSSRAAQLHAWVYSL